MNLISPKYKMKLIDEIELAIRKHFESTEDVEYYIFEWYESDDYGWENFSVSYSGDRIIDVKRTLHSFDDETLLKMAIDLGVETPDFIPSIPNFRNEIKADYPTASSTFEKAFKEIESDPSIAIGLANSALESIIKEILKDSSMEHKIKCKLKGKETLYKLAELILKEFKMFPVSDMPLEIKQICSSLLCICEGIEKLRSDKTDFHGKTSEDYKIKDPIYAYFVVNCVTTIGLFLNSYFKNHFSKETIKEITEDDLPF